MSVVIKCYQIPNGLWPPNNIMEIDPYRNSEQKKNIQMADFIAKVLQSIATWINLCTSVFVKVLSTSKSLSGSSTAAFT